MKVWRTIDYIEMEDMICSSAPLMSLSFYPSSMSEIIVILISSRLMVFISYT
jgi:hypothetical protein